MIRRALEFGLYPISLIITIAFVWYTIQYDWDLRVAYTWMVGVRFALFFALEYTIPAREEWKMTWASLWRDIKYGIIISGFMRGARFLITLLAIDAAAGSDGILAGDGFWSGLILTALFAEFLQYWFHRFCHEGKGFLGELGWKMHVAHHLPDRVYLIMHVVQNPLNSLIVFGLFQFTLVALGASSEAIFAWSALMGLHGLISHFNVNTRAGWLNYIFVTSELHRYHHSANLEESKNYGGFLVIWDQVFGTFIYKPGQLPERLGVVDPESYPNSNNVLKVLSLPFQWKKPTSATTQAVKSNTAPQGD